MVIFSQLRNFIFAIQELTQEQIDTARDFDLVINITSIPEGGTTIKIPVFETCVSLSFLFFCFKSLLSFKSFCAIVQWPGPRFFQKPGPREVVVREGCAWLVLDR